MDVKITGIRYKGETQKGAVFYIAETDSGIIKGKSHLELEINQNFQIEGEWQISKYNGQREFLFRSIIPSLPVTPRARFEYACSITKGIGNCLQEKIWEAVGEGWDDSDLSGIPGIGRETKAAWQTTLIQIKNQKEQADIFAWMMQVGLTANMAAAAWNEWNKDCGGIIQQNPYRLTELPNYGFKAIDDMVINGKEWNIGMLDPRRVKAAILYLLDENAGAGNTAVDFRRFKSLAMDICKGINSDMLQEAMKDNSVVLLNMEYGEDATSVARRKDYDNETRIWRRWTCN